MAKAFRRRASGAALRFAARLDPLERATVAGLMEQVYALLGPFEPEPTLAPNPADASDPTRGGGDDFESIVAGLSGLGGAAMGVSVAAEDQGEWPDPGPVPPDARSFGERDPALERLLPTAHRGDDQAAAEFRRLTEPGLRRRKADNLRVAITALTRDSDAVELTEPQAVAMLVALTDVRLVLGERLGLREDDDVERLEQAADELDADDPLHYALAVYDFLSWLQESLALAMLPPARL